MSESHNIPVGTLVELRNGSRLFVVRHEAQYCEPGVWYGLGWEQYGHTTVEVEQRGFKACVASSESKTSTPAPPVGAGGT